jgi:hypothetical protein
MSRDGATPDLLGNLLEDRRQHSPNGESQDGIIRDVCGDF